MSTLKERALELLADIETVCEAWEIAEADAWIVVSHDSVSDHRTYTGEFATAAEAREYARLLRAQMNRGLGEDDPPFEASIAPLYHPDRQ